MILTTNFDRLLETALEEQGIVPDVVSSDDALKGVVPYVHSKCTVAKLHGDYKDSRIRNTPKELAEYSKELATFLDSVLDEFGLIICGWSGEWDEALKNAVLRCASRRFSTYWISRGEPKEAATELIKHRRAEVIQVDNADQFFAQVVEKLQALRDLEAPHPMSVRMAVSTVKRYLSEERYRIPLYDLMFGEVEKLYAELSSDRFGTHARQLTPQDFQKRMQSYEAASTILISMVSVVAFYDDRGYSAYLTKILERLSSKPKRDGIVVLINLQLYPALLILYAAGIAALAAEHYKHLAAVLINAEYNERGGETARLIDEVNVESVFDSGAAKWVARPNAAREFTPANNYIFDLLRDPLRPYLPDDEQYRITFDIFEYMLGLTYVDLSGRNVGPVGCFKWRYGRFGLEKGLPPIDKFVEKGLAQGPEWSLLKAGFFGGSVERLKVAGESYNKFLATIRMF